MPDDFDLATRRYITASGRVRTRAEIRAAIDKLTDRVKRDAKRIASAFYNGSINEAEFVLQMRELLKSGHIISATVGRGGKARMTQSDWGKVGAKLKWQYKYLDRFARKIGKDLLSEKATMNRVQSYAEALQVTYYKAVHQDFIEMGEGRDVPRDENGEEIMVMLVQNSQEGCEDCSEEAGEWTPVDEMALLGSRACGDFCKCDLVFSTDIWT